jgi:hypothetical protein
VTILASPNTPSNAALSDDTLVTTIGPVTSGLGQIPEGANGTVIAELGNGATYEVLFGPPVNAAEPVTDSLLAVA